MTETPGLAAFLELAPEDQYQAYLVGAEDLRRSATVLEKDVWVCWALGALFTCPDIPDMAFKGGTSLSKVYNAISRFSEDIDITLDHGGLAPDLDPYDPTKGSNAKQRDNDTLKELLLACSNDVIVPHLRAAIAEVGLPADALVVEKDGEELTIRYPHLVEDRESYYREGVRIEFGGRNMIEPNESHRVVPYLAETFPAFSFPVGEVSVLSPARTFWEKFTLAHDESNRSEFKNADRNSRHWHDLAILADHAIGSDAMVSLELLEDVVRVKNRFFRRATSRYELCLTGGANLLPDTAGLELLRRDYEQMVEAGMLDDPITFDEIAERIGKLQDDVNNIMAKRASGT